MSDMIGVIRLFRSHESYYMVPDSIYGMLVGQPWTDAMCESAAKHHGTIVDYGMCNFMYTLQQILDADSPIMVPFRHRYECE